LDFGEDTEFVCHYLEHISAVVSRKECLYYYNKIEQDTLCSRLKENKLETYLNNYSHFEELLKNHNIALTGEDALFFERHSCIAFTSCMRSYIRQNRN
jgi:hypothetical protein